MLDAEHDLLAEMASSLEEHQTPAAVFRHIEAVAQGPVVQPRHDSPPSDMYNHYKRRYAARVMLVRGTLADEQLITGALQPLRKPWLKLRKRNSR